MTVDYLDAVRAQPDNLVRSAAAVRVALAGSAALTALRTGRICVLGMGASAAAAVAFAAALRATGRAVLAVDPGDIDGAVPAGLADAYLAISFSGRSRETVQALAAADHGRRIAVTNETTGPLAEVADVVLPLGSGPDSRVSTLSYTVTLQALGLLADALTGARSDWSRLPEAAARVLAAEVAPIVDLLATVSTVDVIGGDVRHGSALAAALLLREAAHLPAAAYATREYLHGHLEVAGPGHGAVIFGAGREARLAADLAGYGSRVVLVTDAAGPTHPNLHVTRLPAVSGLARCVLDILPVQLSAYGLAARAGMVIDLRHMPADTKLGHEARRGGPPAR